MDADSTLIDALLAAVTVAVLFYVAGRCLFRVVTWARQRRQSAYFVGMAMTPFIALGNVRDPDFRIVQEAKQFKNREEDDSGDPPESENERSSRDAESGRRRRRRKPRRVGSA